MGWLKLSSNILRLNKRLLVLASLLPWLLNGGCVQSKLTKSEMVQRSGLDAQGHPIAFSVLPKTQVGDIDWVAALKEGILNPKGSLNPNGPPESPILN
ncbi:MAG: hypothetical protein HY203_00510, partial [Nitrospirae bacterium]|nr:hypothetical protein [Nitrospirota bacterium]